MTISSTTDTLQTQRPTQAPTTTKETETATRAAPTKTATVITKEAVPTTTTSSRTAKVANTVKATRTPATAPPQTATAKAAKAPTTPPAETAAFIAKETFTKKEAFTTPTALSPLLYFLPSRVVEAPPTSPTTPAFTRTAGLPTPPQTLSHPQLQSHSSHASSSYPYTLQENYKINVENI